MKKQDEGHMVSHRTPSAMLVTVMAAGLFWATHASAALLVNGDAETGDITGWSGTFPPPGIQSVETFDVFAGSYSFQVKRTDPAAGAFGSGEGTGEMLFDNVSFEIAPPVPNPPNQPTP